MWSLGCILAELHQGVALFPGVNEHDMLLLMIELLGMPPYCLIEKAENREKYFTDEGRMDNYIGHGGVERRPAGRKLREVLVGA